MREIKFRVRYNNTWCYINLNEGLTEFGYKAYMECVRMKEKFYQFTGLYDKNGEEIFEGDVITDHVGTGIVEYNTQYGAFRVNYKNRRCKWFYDYSLQGERESIKIIGNIYENPELIA